MITKNDEGDRVDEGLFVRIHGIDQWLTIRGHDRKNPALLILGGPGAALSIMAPFFAPWERDFTLVQWDQPGGGATYARNGEAGTGPLTIDRLVRDGLAVADEVCRRLHADKLVLLGLSGGSIVGLTMAQQRPELFSAYVGSGQIVDWARQDALSYTMCLEQARAAGDRSAIEELKAIGPPTYADAATDAIKAKYAGAMTAAEQAAFAALDPSVMAAVRTPPANARWIAKDLPRHDVRALAMTAYKRMRDEIVAFDARRLGLRFEVPMVFIQGDRDAYTVTSEVQAYAAEIEAPEKSLALLEGGGHSCFFLRDAFMALLKSHVKRTHPGRSLL